MIDLIYDVLLICPPATCSNHFENLFAQKCILSFSPKPNSNHTNPTLETFLKLFPLIYCRTLPLFYIPCSQVHPLIYVRKEVKPTQILNSTFRGLPGGTKRQQIYASSQERGKEIFTPNKYAMLVGENTMLHSNVEVRRLQT
jgi:hypothetical protein